MRSKPKPVIPSHRARQDVETETDYYLFEEGSAQAALGFIDAVEEAYLRLGRNPPWDLRAMPTNSICPDFGRGRSDVTRNLFFM